jgi:hypothetical protein
MFHASRAFLILAFAMSVRQSLSDSTSEPPNFTAAALADLVAQSKGLLVGDVDTTIEVRSFGRRPADSAPPSVDAVTASDEWDTSRVDYWQSTRFLIARDEMYVVSRDCLHPDPTLCFEQYNVWSNGTWSQRVRGDGAVTLFGEIAAPDLFGYSLVFNEMDGRFGSARRIDQEIRSGKCIDQSLDKGVLRYRFESPEAAGRGTRVEVRAELSPQFRLMSYTIEGFFEGDRARPRVRETYRVVEWQAWGEGVIPVEAELVGWSAADPSRERPTATQAMKTYRRTAICEIENMDAVNHLFVTPMPAGTAVYDDRLRLSYEIGKPMLAVEGVLYELHAPLMEPPGDNLSELIRSAVRHTAIPTDAQRESSSRLVTDDVASDGRNDGRAPRSWWPSTWGVWIVLGGAVVMGTAAVFVVARRVRKSNAC